jgi:phosphate transport system substrate-binding protein
MHRWKALRVAVAALAVGAFTLPARPACAGEPLRINGSGSALDFMKALLRSYAASHPQANVRIDPPLGSSGAVSALLAGALDLAVLSRLVSPDEQARGARARPYGRTPLVFVTNPAVKAKNVTTAELEAIYSGDRKAWPDGEPIRVIIRPKKETKTAVLTSLSPGMMKADALAREMPWAVVATTDPESDELVARTPGAIGATSLTSLFAGASTLNRLALDGVEGTPGSLAAGSYRLATEIVFVTTDRTPPEALALVEFAWSAEGQAVAARSGVWVTAQRDQTR